MKKSIPPSVKLPSEHDWRTTDVDELNKRKFRATQEHFEILNPNREQPIFSNFQVKSPSGLKYSVEVRDISGRQFGCDCVDFQINGLGTCKHVEATLLHLGARFKNAYRAALREGSERIEVVPDRAANTLRVSRGLNHLPSGLRSWFDRQGLLHNHTPEEALDAFAKIQDRIPALRISQEVGAWMELRARQAEARSLRHEYEQKVQRGEWPPQETLVPLFPYQREGMLHLAFTERALLADEMGLGKTIQAIAACALLHRLGKATRVLIVTPASLKTEWEDQIQKFTALPYQIVYGQRFERLKAYSRAPFFTIVNYEQMIGDALEVNRRLQPDIVVLDEAQRIKNWSTKTSQATKRLRSRYAFVLTGTPIENRIDELHSLMDFLNPAVLGPHFRFNRDFYELDDRGRPSGFRNLDQLHSRVRPYMLRRRKAEVETELPERTDRNHFVPLSDEQKAAYADHEIQVSRLAHTAKRRPLTKQEQEKLMRELAMCRMVCDTNYILDPNQRSCPKLHELQKVLEECRENSDTKVIVFSEWERMLELVRGLCEKLDLGFAWHTGAVPQKRRRAEINLFKSDPNCRIFLSTDSGSTGLNLQNASVVVNCDLPWNPAKLEQRIARAWRKHQSKPVTVINLVSENTIESRMLGTLAHKQALAEGVLELRGNLKEIKLNSGRQSFLAKLDQLVGAGTIALAQPVAPRAKVLPVDRGLGFSKELGSLLGSGLVRCEERYPREGAHSVMLVVVDDNPANCASKITPLHQEYFGNGDPLSPVQLEVIDRATYEALKRLASAGLISTQHRAIRSLFPGECEAAPLNGLSAEEREKIAELRKGCERKAKMAQLLLGGGLKEETHAPLVEAIHLIGRALALENRMPEPLTPAEALLPPLSTLWQHHLPALRQFMAGDNNSEATALNAIQTLSAQPVGQQSKG
jgi:hypothetical protein